VGGGISSASPLLGALKFRYSFGYILRFLDCVGPARGLRPLVMCWRMGFPSVMDCSAATIILKPSWHQAQTLKSCFVQPKYVELAHHFDDWLDERTSDNCLRAQV
jgi:hypothetical protein